MQSSTRDGIKAALIVLALIIAFPFVFDAALRLIVFVAADTLGSILRNTGRYPLAYRVAVPTALIFLWSQRSELKKINRS